MPENLRRRLLFSLLGLSALAVSGCSSRQRYALGRGAQRSECQQEKDPDRRERCLQDANRSYEDYQRERR